MALSQPRRPASEDGAPVDSSGAFPRQPSTQPPRQAKHSVARATALGWMALLWEDATQRLRGVARPAPRHGQWRRLHDSHGGGMVAIPMDTQPPTVGSRQLSDTVGGRPSSPSWRQRGVSTTPDGAPRPPSPRPGGPWAQPQGLGAQVKRVLAWRPGRRKGLGGGGSAQTLYRDVLRLNSKVLCK